MTQTSNRIMDEFAKLMNDAAGVAQGVKKEAETMFKGQAERFLGEMDLVQREEFDAMRDLAIKAREENGALAAQIEALEARIAKLESAGAKTTRKPASRSTTKAKAKSASGTTKSTKSK